MAPSETSTGDTPPPPAATTGLSGSLLLCLLIAFYLTIVIVQSHLKLLWVDELITYFVASQPGARGIWNALRAGADPNPPLMHLLVQASLSSFGASALAIRIPAILSVLMALISIWWILRRWLQPMFAAAGVLAFMSTRGFDYAYDARSYAALMGFSMAALACWIKSGESSAGRRIGFLVLMSLALVAGFSSNYYGVLAFLPIGAGEIVRIATTRKLHPGTLIALALASLPMIAYLPLIRHNISEFAPHAWNRPRPSMVGLSYVELVEGIVWPVLGMAIWLLWKHRALPWIPPPETAALSVFLLYPIFGFAIAIGGAGMISPRCVVPVCCGFGLVAGLFAEATFGKLRHGPLTVVLILLLWVTVREGVCSSFIVDQRHAFLNLRGDIAGAHPARIVVADTSFTLPLWFYSEPAIRKAIIVPIDFDAIHRYQKDDSGEQNLWAGRQGIFPFRIQTLEVGAKPRAGDLVIASPNGWLARSLASNGTKLSPGPDDARWAQLGGVFTPMGHFETRIETAVPAQP